jgi:hypothetical protein
MVLLLEYLVFQFDEQLEEYKLRLRLIYLLRHVLFWRSIHADLHLKQRNFHKYYVVGYYPPSCLFFKKQRFGDWILSPSSGKTYSDGPNR